MKYQNTLRGIFKERPNRFIAHVEVEGQINVCHVKNTGRCRELLVPDATVVLERAANPARKTPYDLIAVYKDGKLINIDSQAPNCVVGEWLAEGGFFRNIALIRPEYTYKSSRFDFYLEADGKKIFAEVKGVTLEQDGVVLFPDAPTERGVKHLHELIDATQNGYEAYIFFVVQMKDCRYFTPNAETHPEFAEALRLAAHRGGPVVALSCNVSENTLSINAPIEIKL